MTRAAERIDYGDPVTQALFDRTPKQRAAYGRHMLRLMREGIGLTDPEFHFRIGMAMYDDFLRDVDADIAQRAEDLHETALDLEQLPPGARTDQAFTAQARREITAEIAELHTKCPAPMLGRLANA